MSLNLDFLKFDRTSNFDQFFYNTKPKLDEDDYEKSINFLNRTGFNLQYNIMNYMAEPVLLGGNLKAGPQRIKSLLSNIVRPGGDVNNFVIITIYRSENNNSPDPKKRNIGMTKTEIRIPGRMLNQGSVFIEELDGYIMTESQLDATRSLIVSDIYHSDAQSVNIPASMVKQDPETLYIKAKELTEACIKRQDKISIRVGVDIKQQVPPDIMKTMRISILDSNFVPFKCNKLIYDPTLDPDQFIIENLHLASRQEFIGTFSELAKAGSIYLDYNETQTLFGKFYGMGIFANERVYLNYVHKSKSQERFREETLYVARRSGDPILKEKIDDLERSLGSVTTESKEKDETITTQNALIKRLKADVKDREETITKIRHHHEEKLSPDVILADMQNEAGRIHNDARKIDHERIELEHREKAAPYVHKAAMFKTVADIVKSGWGIAAACLGGVLSIVALCKKYNIKLVMGT